MQLRIEPERDSIPVRVKGVMVKNTVWSLWMVNGGEFFRENMFEKLKSLCGMSLKLHSYISEFQRMESNLKKQNKVLPEPVIAYRVLKCVNGPK